MHTEIDTHHRDRQHTTLASQRDRQIANQQDRLQSSVHKKKRVEMGRNQTDRRQMTVCAERRRQITVWADGYIDSEILNGYRIYNRHNDLWWHSDSKKAFNVINWRIIEYDKAKRMHKKRESRVW